MSDLTQGSDEWKQARCGKVTTSRYGDVIARTKSGYGASRANYMAELLCERMTGEPADHFVSGAMQWGTDNEPLARSEYEGMRGVMVETVGFLDHPNIVMCGGSPDGLVGSEGAIEIKCPNTATHIDTLRRKAADPKYIPQMQGIMDVCGREWCDFVSYDPRMPEGLQIVVYRVPRNEEYISMLHEEIVKFLEELDKMVIDLEAIRDELKEPA